MMDMAILSLMCGIVSLSIKISPYIYNYCISKPSDTFDLTVGDINLLEAALDATASKLQKEIKVIGDSNTYFDSV
ncbi:MAG: hypothetical protein EOP33_00445 [Rickettsiaceae bacterium]|nr:MAG: hypothetical protein EOP33_00445 [Rickettsiaceae bacterium]